MAPGRRTFNCQAEARIFLVVPVHNRKTWTAGFLRCIQAQTFRNFQVIVVDDGSTDGTGELVKSEYPEATLLRGDGNLWWTGAINLGIRNVMGRALASDAVLVINDDLEVSPNYLEVLYRLWQSRPRTLIGSVLVDIDNPDVIYNGGNAVNWWTAKFAVLNRGRRLSEFGNDYYLEASFLTGRGTLIPISVFHEIGLYDDKHFQQCGDTELPVRARKHGYRLIVSYDAVVKTPLSSDVNVTHYGFWDAKGYFLSIKSNHRLKYRVFFSLKTATSPAQCISFLVLDVIRITWHFVCRLKISSRKRSAIVGAPQRFNRHTGVN
jgi:N-acetylglucosaminyl-diphospho-decaprenol L-rhamnosyltransferase